MESSVLTHKREQQIKIEGEFKVNGKSMLETNIEYMIEAKIDRVVIIVGYRAVAALKKNPCEENLWKCVVAFRGYKFKTMSGLSFTYTLKKGKGDEFTKELWIDRREESKSLAWSSVMLAYHNIGKIGEVVDRPKALGDIRGVSYIYGLFYRFGLIDVPDKAKEKMGGKEH